MSKILYLKLQASKTFTEQSTAYRDILALSDSMAGALVRQGVKINRDQIKIISILFPTGLDFLVIWVSLMRMGYGVVLVA
jgi:acyl-CoA synthetase (AMP-forming)/AMP-acid ligase II